MAYHFHWSLDEILDLEHPDRQRFVDEIASHQSSTERGGVARLMRLPWPFSRTQRATSSHASTRGTDVFDVRQPSGAAGDGASCRCSQRAVGRRRSSRRRRHFAADLGRAAPRTIALAPLTHARGLDAPHGCARGLTTAGRAGAGTERHDMPRSGADRRDSRRVRPAIVEPLEPRRRLVAGDDRRGREISCRRVRQPPMARLGQATAAVQPARAGVACQRAISRCSCRRPSGG